MCGVYRCHFQARFLDQVLADNLVHVISTASHDMGE